MKKAGERTTSLVNSVWHGAKGSLNNRTSYRYDNNGNIVSIYENGKEKVSYKYDSVNRLIQECSGTVTNNYAYDRGGNILSKTVVSGGATTENVYEYGITGNRDRLLKYNGLNFVYDTMGNPTTYRSKALIWEKDEDEPTNLELLDDLDDPFDDLFGNFDDSNELKE
ncbi:hypothetical protein EOM82_01680 [bacterium]|nr:hypothetical protein [bacterium]